MAILHAHANMSCLRLQSVKKGVPFVLCLDTIQNTSQFFLRS